MSQINLLPKKQAKPGKNNRPEDFMKDVRA